MARSWVEPVRDIYESMGEITQEDKQLLREIDYSERELKELFDTGFLAYGIDPDTRSDARESFFETMEFLGYDREDFDWQAWREWKGYDEK
jgi:hypothetical protein